MNELIKKIDTLISQNIIFNENEISNLSGSCAVVGNSGNVLYHDYGDLIDSHDYVIRCNNAPTAGYEKHVGAKKNIRIVNSHMFYAAIENTTLDVPRMKRIFSKFDENAIYKLCDETLLVKNGVNIFEFQNVIKKVEENNNRVCFVDSQFYQNCNRFIGNHATSGFVALIYALKYFQKVSCFGFSFFEDDWSRMHYYEYIQPYKQATHNFLNEKKAFTELGRIGKISIYPDFGK